jgi:hypothetical protein
VTVYLHQVHSLTGRAAVAPLLAAVEHDHLPLLERLDVRQVGYWETTAVQGRTNEVVAIWELDDYRHLQRLARAMHGGDADGRDLRAWREREAEWVAHTESLVCEPGSTSPTVADLRAGGVRAAMACHETVICKPWRHMEYPELLADMWSTRFNANPDAPKSGRTTIGLYYAKWSNTIAINIWGYGADWDGVVIWDPEWEQDPSFALWNTLGREIRDDFTDRFLVPAPFSTVR